MDLLQFTASVIKSSVWPITVVALAIVFRSDVGRAIHRLTRLRYKGLEVEFGQRLAEAKADAKRIDVQPKVVPLALTSRDEDAERLLPRAAQMAAQSPESAILIAWAAIDAELTVIAKRLGVTIDERRFVPDMMVVILAQMDFLDKQTLALLDRMRNLRDMAARGSGTDRIRPDEAVEFVALAAGVVEHLQSLGRPPRGAS